VARGHQPLPRARRRPRRRATRGRGGGLEVRGLRPRPRRPHGGGGRDARVRPLCRERHPPVGLGRPRQLPERAVGRDRVRPGPPVRAAGVAGGGPRSSRLPRRRARRPRLDPPRPRSGAGRHGPPRRRGGIPGGRAGRLGLRSSVVPRDRLRRGVGGDGDRRRLGGRGRGGRCVRHPDPTARRPERDLRQPLRPPQRPPTTAASGRSW
jgi:hypothetical protein